MIEDIGARALHDEALRVRLAPIGAEWVGTRRYRIGSRIYDLSVTDPARIGVALAEGLAPLVETEGDA